MNSTKVDPISLVDQLTPQETKILTYVAHGYTNNQIAHKLTLSTRTIEKYVNTIYFKLHARNRPHALYLSFLKGYLSIKRLQEEAELHMINDINR